MNSPEKTQPSAEAEWTVTGMDCASCATKIQGALQRLAGVENVSISIMSERLGLRLTGKANSDDVERVVTQLGYKAQRIPSAGESPTARLDLADKNRDHATETTIAAPKRPLKNERWYNTTKGRLVIFTGVLLALAWGATQLLPASIAEWPFVAACLIGLVPVAKRAFAALRSGMPFTIEMLMTMAAGGALFIGAAAEAAMVIFLFAIGEVLEGVAADRARAGIRALANLVPKTARLVEGETVREVPAESLSIGQIVLVRPGDRIPADGEIAEGMSGIDESPVTGESMPKVKGPGEPVFAGSINAEAALRLRVTRDPEDNTIARIIRLVEEAQEAKAPTERFIDRFSRYYMPAVVALSVLVAIVPPLAVGEDWSTWIYRGLAILLIGCPCALVISVPASIASALSAGARQGLLMKGGAVLEAAAKITIVTFDKTGTLTQGKPVVTDVVPMTSATEEILALAGGVESGSSHPLAEAILAEAAKRNISIRSASAATVIPGRGVRAEIEGRSVFVGSPRHAEEENALSADAKNKAAELESAGKTVAVLFRDRETLGLIALRDEAREDAAAGIRDLKALGVRAMMLTGDNERTAAAIAGKLGMEYRAALLPADKVAAIRELTSSEQVMMVGDGINDAPALAAAHLGVAMGSGTDVALETADGALMRNRVTDVAGKIRLARATMANIRQNIIISLGLKAVFLLTTVIGITGLWPAILADTGATVLVTLNALRLLAFKPAPAWDTPAGVEVGTASSSKTPPSK